MTEKMTFPISVRSVKEKGEHVGWLAKQPQLNIEAEGDLIEETFKECVKKVRTQIETFHIGGRLVFRDEYVLSEGVASQYYGGILSTREDFIKLNGTLFVTVRQDASLDQFGEEPPIKCSCDEPCEDCTCEEEQLLPTHPVLSYVTISVPEGLWEMGVFQVLEDGGDEYLLQRIQPKRMTCPYDFSGLKAALWVPKNRIEPIPDNLVRPDAKFCEERKCKHYIAREESGAYECNLCGYLPSSIPYCQEDYNNLLHTQMRIIESNRRYAEPEVEEETA